MTGGACLHCPFCFSGVDKIAKLVAHHIADILMDHQGVKAFHFLQFLSPLCVDLAQIGKP